VRGTSQLTVNRSENGYGGGGGKSVPTAYQEHQKFEIYEKMLENSKSWKYYVK
jgi:hypothetical protein